jgi:hypothetical protein
MVRGRLLDILVLVGALAILALFAQPALTAEVPRMTKEELKSLLGNPGIIILDVRAGFDWDDSGWKIPGALREDPRKELRSWVGKYPKEKTLILYCA